MSRFRVGCDEAGYYLEDSFSRQHPLRVDFSQPEFLSRLRGAGKKTELVARAVKRVQAYEFWIVRPGWPGMRL